MRVDPANLIDGADASSGTHMVLKYGTRCVGALAMAGSFTILAHGGAAQAKTLGSPTTHSHTTHTRTPSATASQPAVGTKYVVKKGDTLTDIARKSGVTLDALVSANQIDPNKFIQIGQNLVIPASHSPNVATSGIVSNRGTLPSDLPKNSSRWALRPAFQRAAKQYGVPAGILEAMAWNESGWQNGVVSSTGALGIGQLMPDTVTFVNGNLVSKPLDPKTNEGNIKMSASYLHYLINQNKGDYRMALASYYQGQKSIQQHGMYNDTKQYVATVLALDNRYF